MACQFFYNGETYTKDELINLINEGKVAEVQRAEIKYTQFDNEPLRVLMNLRDEETLTNHLETFYPEQLEKVRSYNPDVTFSFSDDTISGFDSATNNVNISLSEMYYMANNQGLDYNETLNYFVEHELTHALTLPGSLAPDIEKYLTSALNKARQLYNRKPFVDNTRGGVLFEGYPYALHKVQEFLAEHQSNPDFRNWMKQISSGNETFWEKIQNFLRGLIGLGPVNSFYSEISDLIDSEEYRLVGLEILELYPDEFKMEGVFNFNKIWFNTAELLKSQYETNPELKEIFANLPKTLSQLKRKLSDAQDNRRRLEKEIKSIKPSDPQKDIKIEALTKEILKVDKNINDIGAINSNIKKLYEDLDTENRIKTLIDVMQSVYLISENLAKDTQDLLKSDIPKEVMIHSMFLLSKQADSLRVMDDTIAELSNILQDSSIADVNSRRFVSQMSRIANNINVVNAEYIKLSKSATIQRFSISEANSKVASELRNLIARYQDQLTKTEDPKQAALIQKRIDDSTKRLNVIPTENVIKAIINGELPDASITDLNLQALALNGNPLIQTGAKMLTDADNKLAERRGVRQNIMSTILNNFKKAVGISSTRDMKGITNKIAVPVTRVNKIIEKQDGTLQEDTVQQLMFITEYSPEYITDFEKINANIEFWEEKRNREKDDEKRREINDKISQLYEDRYNFQKNNSEGYYKDSYYKHKDVLNEKITGTDENGEQVTTSLGERFRELFEQIEVQERYKRQTIDPQTLLEISEELERLWTEYAEVSSRYTNLGVEKTGIDKALYEKAVKYREERNKIGTRVLSDSDLIAFNQLKDSFLQTRDEKIRGFDRDLLRLDEEQARGIIDPVSYQRSSQLIEKNKAEAQLEYENGLKSIHQVSPTQEYFETREYLQGEVEKLREQILKIPQIKELLGGEDETKKLSKENYKKLAELTRAYRDNDGAIDGIAYTKNKPDSVSIIKEIQEAEILLSENMRKVTGLSYAENKEYNDLRILKGLRSGPQEARFKELSNIKKEIKGVKGENKALFDEYANALSRLMELSTPTETKYYNDEVERQKKKLKTIIQEDALSREEEWLQENNLVRNKDNSISRFDAKPDGTIIETKKFRDVLEAISVLSTERANNDFQQSEWFVNNHYDYKKWNPAKKKFDFTKRPIYIWIEQQPTDPIYIGEPEPLFSFKTFVINEDQLNPNYKLIAPGLSQPKTTSKYYDTSKLDELRKDKPYFDLHQNLRNFYNQSQLDTDMQDNERLYDIIPSIPKHTQENKVDFVDSLVSTGFGQTIKNFWQEGLGRVDEDSQLIQGGSISKRFKENKIIPYRFNNKMDISKQSYDLFSGLLIYDNINSDVLNKKGLEEVFQSALAATDSLERRVEGTVAGAFSISNMISRLRNKSKSTPITEIKEGKSVLNTTIQHMLDTYIYGESKTEATFNAMGTTMDGHKIASGIKTLSSTMIFSLKWFGPVKNYLSSTINGFINTGLGEGFASKKDYAKAVSLAPTKIRFLLSDYRKIGNKSQFGQAMDFFKVLHGGVYNEYGKFTQWSALGEVNRGNMAIIKNSTELAGQVTTFLSISFANPVEINGKEVPFHEAFETVEGKFQPKANALYNGNPITQNDINLFIGKISHVNRRLNGAFRDLEKTKAEKHWLGSLAFYLNGFVMPGIASRFGKEEYLAEADMVTRGYYKEGISFLGDYFRNANLSSFIKDYNRVYSTLTKEQQNRTRMFFSELTMATLFSVAGLLMAAGGGDTKKKLRKNTALYNFLFALTMGVGSEVQTFVPLPGLGMDEALRKAATPFAAVRQLILIGKIFGHLGEAIGGGGRFEKKGVADGLHDKGDLKILADLISLTGWNMKEWDSVEKVIQVKQSQQLR